MIDLLRSSQRKDLWDYGRLMEVDCFVVSTVNFRNDIIFFFCSYSIFWLAKKFTRSVFKVESRHYFARSKDTP